MTDPLASIVSRIEQKAFQAVQTIEKLELENRQLKSRLQESEVSLQIYKQKIKELENKNSILKVSGCINRNNTKQEAQKAQSVIESLIKEIDRCLLLLDQ